MIEHEKSRYPLQYKQHVMDSVLSEMFEILIYLAIGFVGTRDRLAFYGMQYKQQDNEAVFIQTNKVGTNKRITIDPCLA